MTHRTIKAFLAAFALLMFTAITYDAARAQTPIAKFISQLSFNQLPDCSSYGPGKYVYYTNVPTNPPSMLNRPTYDCVRLDATISITAGKPALLTIPAPSVINIGFIYGETPAGVIDGMNTVFTLANIPNPATSLQLFRNLGIAAAGTDYTLSGRTITFNVPPSAGDTLFVPQYRTQ